MLKNHLKSCKKDDHIELEIPKKFKTISNKEMDMIIIAKKYC